MADKKSEDVVVSSIVVKIGDDKKSLTLEQAKKLWQALAQLFEESKKECCHHYSYPWIHYYTNPIFGNISSTGVDNNTIKAIPSWGGSTDSVGNYIATNTVMSIDLS